LGLDVDDDDAAVGIFLGAFAERVVFAGEGERKLEAGLTPLPFAKLILFALADLLDDEGGKHVVLDDGEER
jgi:hypothetical protein